MMATAAMAPVAIRNSSAQPYRNAGSGPHASRRYTYPPPAFGRRAPSSPKHSAPTSATTPPTTQATMMSGADPTRSATVAGVRKMPPPMMPPITAIVPEKRPRRRAYVTRDGDDSVTGREHAVPRDVAKGEALPPLRAALHVSPILVAEDLPHVSHHLHRARQPRHRERHARHPVALGVARHARTHRHQVRLRHRAVRRLHGAPGRRRDAHLRAARGGGRRQARDHDRRPVSQPLTRGAARLDRGGRPPVRLLPVGPDHGRRRAAGQEPAPLGRRHRHRDDDPLPLRHLPADPRRHPSRGAGGVTCEPPPTSLGVSSSRPRRSPAPAWSSASISPRAPGSVPPPWLPSHPTRGCASIPTRVCS